MKKLLNTLYITCQESYLHKERETVVIMQGSEKLGQFPVLVLGNILCFGQVSVSPALMGFCGERGIGLSFYSVYGKFLARVHGRQTGNIFLRRTQYRWADDPEKSLSVARIMISAKIANCRSVLLREIRNHGENAVLSQSIEKLSNSLQKARFISSIDQLLGIEGEAAAIYFAVFRILLRTAGFDFVTRTRRPPKDPVNALLSLVYSLVTHECLSALSGVGLDPYAGFLHQDRSGRPSLALDLLEEFRAPLADRFVLTLINRKQIQPKDFVTEASGAVRLTDDARKILFTAYQERKQTEIIHPYLQEKVPLGLLAHVQSLLLTRHLRGDTQFYPPYLMK